MDAVLPYLADAAGRTLLQLLALAGPALVLGLAMHLLAGFVESRAVAAMGVPAYLALFGAVGTAVHETGHVIFCPLFAHRITAFRPFAPDPASGVLGYVQHAWNPRNPWALLGNLVIGVGPVILGTAVLYGASRLLLGTDVLGRLPPPVVAPDAPVSAAGLWALASGVAGAVWAALGGVVRAADPGRWQTWLFGYLAFSVGTGIRLSPSDLRGAASGFAVLVLLLLAANLATGWAGDLTGPLVRALAPALGVFLGVMAFALALAAAFALPVWGLARLRGTRAAPPSSRTR